MDTTIIVAIIAFAAAIIAGIITALAGISVPFISHWLKQRATAKKKPPRTTDTPRARGHNPLFTGREEILARIKEKLHSAGRVVLTGIPGVGKTQTAAEYAYQQSKSYKQVLWVTADSRDSLRSGFVALAQKLKLDEKDEAELERVVAAVRACLESGLLDQARKLLTDSERLAEETGEKFWLMEIQRYLGSLTVAENGDPALAEDYFRRALAAAEAREANGFALRAAIDLARHLDGDGRGDEGREILSGIVARFDAGDDSADLRAAKPLLA